MTTTAHNTKEEVAALGETDPEFAEYIKKHNLQHISDLAKIVSPTGADNSADVDSGETLNIPLRDGSTSQIRIFQPKNAPAKKPLIVMSHGGGFFMGDNNQLSPLSRVVSGVYRAMVVNISYRLAPAYKFPTAANDAWDSLKWLADNYQALGADPSTGFILYGASAGGNLAAVVAQKWLDEECFPLLTGISLSVPIILEEPIVPDMYKELWFSRDQNADAMVLNKQSMMYMMQSYEPDIHSPEYSPFNSKNPHAGLPPVYLCVSGQDPLRDDGLVYEKILRDHGVKTKLDVYPGVPHGHGMFPGLQSGKQSFFDTVKSFGWLLGDETSDEDVRKLLPGGEPRWS